MSESADAGPPPELVRDAQLWLSELDEISESKPADVIAATDDASIALARWPRSAVYALTQALRAKCFRFLDDLAGVLGAVESGLAARHDGGLVAGQLHLEAGMALNQFGEPLKAAEHLRQSEVAFREAGEAAGQAWVLVSLAESYAASGYPEDAEPPLRRALVLAREGGDPRAERRAWKQLAVLLRHRGDVMAALTAIHHALDGAPAGQVRANYELEYGHLLAMTGNYTQSDETFEDVAAAYAEWGDRLGLANVERAIASNALILGRARDGERRLDSAIKLYRDIGNVTGQGYALRDRALVRQGDGRQADATADIEEGLTCFRASPDTLGLAAMLRSAAQVRRRTGNLIGARAALAEARELTADGSNPLADAGICLMEAELAPTPSERLNSAGKAVDLYRRMHVTTGEAMALAEVAKGARSLGQIERTLTAVAASAAALRRSRTQVTDPDRRADHDFAIRDVATDLLSITLSVEGPAAAEAAADLLVDAAPMGLRSSMKDRHLDGRVQDTVNRVEALPVRDQATERHRHLLQQLNALLATVPPGEPPAEVRFRDVAVEHPSAALLVYGAPTRDGDLPIAWALPGNPVQSYLAPLDSRSVAQIDALAGASEPDATTCLWDPRERNWQNDLTNVLLPRPLVDWLRLGIRELAVYLPPVLNHLPVEALLTDDVPLGVAAAVTRIPVPGAPTLTQELKEVVAYLDPHFAWTHEKNVLGTWTDDPRLLRAALAKHTLLSVGCHGEHGVRAESALVAHSGDRVLDAFDLLARDLTGSVLVFEACHAGRYVGARTGEQLTLATIGLLAKASAVIAGLFALPADDSCTGVIAAHCLGELRSGTPPAEALRRARSAYWQHRPQVVRRPGGNGQQMAGDAPWTWAGLCVWGR